MKNARRAPLAVALGLALAAAPLAVAAVPAVALAEDAAVASEPTSGWTLYKDTCEYRVDESGCLVLRPLGGAASAELATIDGLGSWYGLNPTSFRIEGSIKVTGDLSGAFAGMSSLYSINLYGLDTSSVTSMESMFAGCTSLTWMDLSPLDTSSVTDMWALFAGCSNLSSVGLGNIDTSNVTTMRCMFGGCTALTWLDVSKLDTSSVTDMQEMFQNCTSLTQLDLSGFDTSKVKAMDCMFSGCTRLQTLDLSSFDTSHVKNKASDYGLYGDMFGDGTYPTTIKIGKKFNFKGSTSKRFIKFPSDTSAWADDEAYTGKWVSSVDGKAYAADKIPNGVAATYTAEKATAMHRLYNPYTGEHLYTSSAQERDSLRWGGWNYEGIGWVAPTTSNTKVYRLYNPYAPGGDHHYTTSLVEYNSLVAQGWSGEGEVWYSADEKEGTPLYRQYNPFAQTGTHNYTTSTVERDNLVSLGWRKEGVGWYGL